MKTNKLKVLFLKILLLFRKEDLNRQGNNIFYSCKITMLCINLR